MDGAKLVITLLVVSNYIGFTISNAIAIVYHCTDNGICEMYNSSPCPHNWKCIADDKNDNFALVQLARNDAPCPGTGKKFDQRFHFCYCDERSKCEIRDRFADNEIYCQDNDRYPHDKGFECCTKDGHHYGLRYQRKMGYQCDQNEYKPESEVSRYNEVYEYDNTQNHQDACGKFYAKYPKSLLRSRKLTMIRGRVKSVSSSGEIKFGKFKTTGRRSKKLEEKDIPKSSVARLLPPCVNVIPGDWFVIMTIVPHEKTWTNPRNTRIFPLGR